MNRNPTLVPSPIRTPISTPDVTFKDPVRLFVKRAPLPCQPVLMSTFLAEVASLCSSFAFLSALFALAAGRHFTNPVLTTREQEILVGAMSLYFFFGMLQSACINEISCGVSVLSFQVGRCPCFGPHKLLTWLPRQVLRILIIFVIFLLINASVDRCFALSSLPPPLPLPPFPLLWPLHRPLLSLFFLRLPFPLRIPSLRTQSSPSPALYLQATA